MQIFKVKLIIFLIKNNKVVLIYKKKFEIHIFDMYVIKLKILNYRNNYFKNCANF